MQSIHACHGEMFADLMALNPTGKTPGKVISVITERVGGTYIANHEIVTDPVQWDRCRECEEFDDCYKLSLAKLTMQAAFFRR